MSYATLISSLRRALQDIVVRGNELEQRWAAELARQKRRTTQPKEATKLQAMDDQVAPPPVLTEPLRPKRSTVPDSSPASPSPYTLSHPSSPSSPVRRPRILISAQLLRTSNNQASFALNAMMQRFKDGLLVRSSRAACQCTSHHTSDASFRHHRVHHTHLDLPLNQEYLYAQKRSTHQCRSSLIPRSEALHHTMDSKIRSHIIIA